MKDETNQDLVNLLKSENGTPVYVQLGLNPNYYQFHSPSAEDPITAGYWKPSYAGVLTGYDFMNDKEFWEVYIRRHKYSDNVNNNYVRVGAVFEKNGEEVNPFAGITSMAFTVSVTEESKDQNLVEGKEVVIEVAGIEGGTITTLEKLVEFMNETINNSQETANPIAPMDKITSIILDPRPLVSLGAPVEIKEIFPSLIAISIPYEAMDVVTDVFADFWDVEEINFYDLGDTGGRRLAGERKTLTVKGAVKKLSCAANTFPNYDLSAIGKKCDYH